jgi:glycosyltransferase involved in cell wall biosynthesis
MRILIISPHFPTPDYYDDLSQDPRSKFLLRYAISWTNLGCFVKVLHVPPRYPLFFNWIARSLKNIRYFKRYNLTRFIQKRESTSDANYVYRNVKVMRRTITKLIPGRDYFALQIKLFKWNFLANENIDDIRFDVIFVDYLSPSFELAEIFTLKDSGKLCPIVHQTDLSYFSKELVKYKKYIEKSDLVLYRSKSLAEKFSRFLPSRDRTSFMFSGVPDDTIFSIPRKKVLRFLYVGTLRESKNIHHIVIAIASIRRRFPQITLDLVGEGEFEDELRCLVRELDLSCVVNFKGKLNHREVFEAMRSADCLVMVSKETFGMVYIEAMSQGCIVIAAKGEGIDGVVIDSENGFLLPLDDIESLKSLMTNLVQSEEQFVLKVSESALLTAMNMTDKQLAKKILIDIKDFDSHVAVI